MAADHEAMYAEVAAFARRRGWRREPEARQEVAAQLAHHAARWRLSPAGDESVDPKSRRMDPKSRR